MKAFGILCLIFLLTRGSPASGHDTSMTPVQPPDGLMISGAVATHWRSEAIVPANQRWIVPGFFMGGEAFPRPNGFHLDEASLSASYRQESSYVAAKIGQHGEEDAKFEHVWIGHFLSDGLLLEAGKMTSLMLSQHAQHSSQARFADSPLMDDVFWGRHYADTGVRLRSFWSSYGLELGLEIWQGERFPSDRDEKNQESGTAYIRWQLSRETWMQRLGLFYFDGQAARRKDDRYEAGHSHGVDLNTIPAFYFKGDVEIMGAEAISSWAVGREGSIGGELAWQSLRSRGELADLTRTAPIETDSHATKVELFAQWAQHLVAGRYERLQFRNTLRGAAAGVLAEAASLKGEASPYRSTLAYQYNWDETFRLRAEWTRDFTTIRRIDLGLVGFVWFQAYQAKGM